ncbi:MAG: hypothetical protein ACOYBD_08885 [Bilifractor sp.]
MNDKRGRNSQIPRKIQGGTETEDHNAHDEEAGPHRKRRIRKQRIPEPGRKFYNVTQEKQIDKGGDAHLMPVHQEINHKQREIQEHVDHAISQRRKIPHAVRKNLKGIHTEAGEIKHPHAESGDQNPGNRHRNPSLKFCHFHNPSLSASACFSSKPL